LVFLTGAVPAATFGQDIHGIPAPALKLLMQGARRSAALNTIGVDTNTLLQSWPTYNRPDFQAIAAPILRFAREVRMTIGPGAAYQHGDELHTRHFHKIYARLTHEPAEDEPGIISTLRHSLQQVDWQLSGPYSFLTRQGLDIQLDVNPPAEVKKCLARDFEHRVDRLCQQKWPEHTLPLDWPLLRSLLRKKHWAPAAKKVLLQLFPHFLPTRSWMHARGIP
jgi:hypothetical protein